MLKYHDRLIDEEVLKRLASQGTHIEVATSQLVVVQPLDFHELVVTHEDNVYHVLAGTVPTEGDTVKARLVSKPLLKRMQSLSNAGVVPYEQGEPRVRNSSLAPSREPAVETIPELRQRGRISTGWERLEEVNRGGLPRGEAFVMSGNNPRAAVHAPSGPTQFQQAFARAKPPKR